MGSLSTQLEGSAVLGHYWHYTKTIVSDRTHVRLLLLDMADLQQNKASYELSLRAIYYTDL